MNWAIKITILYLGFVGIIVTLMVISMRETVDLESKDYYARELKFGEQIAATENALALTTPIESEVSGKSVLVTIPRELLDKDFSGEAMFFRPADARLDRRVPLVPDANGSCVIEIADVAV